MGAWDGGRETSNAGLRRPGGMLLVMNEGETCWERSGFTTSRLRDIFADTLSSLNRRPPPGRKWTLHCIRAGPASECNALGIPLSTIRRQGGWGPKSRVPSDRYIDHQCPPSIAGRRFFDWLTPDGRLRRLGAS